MSTEPIALPDLPAEQRSQQIDRDLKSLGLHDWSLWCLALVVILAMTATLSAVLASHQDSSDPFFQLTMGQSVRGLLGLVLLFTVYTFYQQLQLRKTRYRLSCQMRVAAQQHERAESLLALATPDELTGLHNERFGMKRISSEMSRSRRSKTPLTLLMLSLNDFAGMNERYGSAASDSALLAFAEHVTRAIRGCDLAALAGNGHLMVILPDCPVQEAPSVVKRLADMKMEVGGETIPLTVTAGSAAYQLEDTPEQLAQRARQALPMSS
ncbi:MAG: GGDEF domain-containing protein [Candidatus Acidiferrales bacterium]